jgi:hypothetical protein
MKFEKIYCFQILILFFMGLVFFISESGRGENLTPTLNAVALNPNLTPEVEPKSDEIFLPEYFDEAVQKYLKKAKWASHDKQLIDPKVLETSLDEARVFLIANQKPEGNFNYDYDWVLKKTDEKDNQVRQAGALWGLALLYQRSPSSDLKNGIEKGFDYFFRISVPGPEKGSLAIAYENYDYTSVGTVALLGLAIIDYLRSNPPISEDDRTKIEMKLDGYLKFLVAMQNDNGHFYSKFILESKEKIEKPVPFYDGEGLLCLVKAAKYMNNTELIPVIQKLLPALTCDYVNPVLAGVLKSDETKEFYQWGSMAWGETRDTGWVDPKQMDSVMLVLAYWQIHVRDILEVRANTGYAIEGLVPAYEAAKELKNKNAAKDIRWTVNEMIKNLLRYQVEGPLAPEGLVSAQNTEADSLAKGGFINAAGETKLRIDVTQHMAHAILMDLDSFYR